LEPHIKEHKGDGAAGGASPTRAAPLPVEMQKAIIGPLCGDRVISKKEDMWWLATVEANAKAGV
jgi:hypothetical protein